MRPKILVITFAVLIAVAAILYAGRPIEFDAKVVQRDAASRGFSVQGVNSLDQVHDDGDLYFVIVTFGKCHGEVMYDTRSPYSKTKPLIELRSDVTVAFDPVVEKFKKDLTLRQKCFS